MRNLTISSIAISVLLVGSGCSTLGLSTSKPVVTERLVPVGSSPWSLDFGDPILRNILKESDLGAIDIKIAIARRARADVEFEAAKAFSRSRVEIGFNSAVGGRSPSNRAAAGTPSLAVAKDFDLSGRSARAQDAAEYERRAMGSEVIVARRLVGAETTRAYFALRAAQSLVNILTSERISALRLADLTRALHAEVRTNQEEVTYQTEAVADLDEKLAEARLEVQLQTLRLGVLLNKAADISILPSTLIPSDLPMVEQLSSEDVVTRPDVEAAYARLQAADSHRAEAVAATRPRLVLTAYFGAAESSIINLLDVKSLAWALAAEVSQNILDGGARKARISAAMVEVDLADLAYRKTVVQAWADTRIALAHVVAADAELKTDESQCQLLRTQLELVHRRAKAGVADTLDVLIANDRVTKSEIYINASRLRAVMARIDLALTAPGE
jgi:outer membrane protein TolC